MPDIQQLAESTLGRVERLSVKAELKRAGEIIQPGEDVAMLAVGSYTGSGNNLIIVTDRRLIAINEVGAFNKRLHVQDITYDRITHVQSEDSRINGRVILATAGGEIEASKILPTGRAGEIAAYVRTRLGASSSSPATPDIAEQIRRLADLHAAGIVTDAEFDAKKAELLTRL